MRVKECGEGETTRKTERPDIMKNPTREKFITFALILILPIATAIAAIEIITTPFIADPSTTWSRTLPPDEPFGTLPQWIAVRRDGPVEIVSPTSAIAIKHPTYGFAARPGDWVWRKIDDEVRAQLFGLNTPALEVASDPAEVEKLKKRVSRALEALTAP